MDKNKSAYKLKGMPPIYYLNLDGQPERKQYIEEQFKYWDIENYERISAYDGRDDDLSYIIKGRYPDNMTSGDFSTASYMITRRHAEKLVGLHCRGNKYKLDQGVKPRAVADDLVYNSGNTFAIPLFLYKIALGSSIHPEHVDIFHKNSYEGLMNFWTQNGPGIEISQLMDYNPFLGRMTEHEEQPQ